MNLRLVLGINDGIEAILHPDEPLVLVLNVVSLRPEELSLTPPEAEPSTGEQQPHLGSIETAWTKLVKFIDGQNREVSWPIHLISKYPADEVLPVPPPDWVEAQFGVDPEELEQLDSGTYKLRAIVGWNNLIVESNPVTITLTDEPLPATKLERVDYLEATARYYLKRGADEKALNWADQMIRIAPGSVESFVVLGDIQRQAGRLQEALATYTKAEQLFWEINPDSYEGPETVASRIVGVLAELEQSNDGRT